MKFNNTVIIFVNKYIRGSYIQNNDLTICSYLKCYTGVIGHGSCLTCGNGYAGIGALGLFNISIFEGNMGISVFVIIRRNKLIMILMKD